MVNITNRCNLECKHCYVSSSPSGHIGLADEDLLRLVDSLKEIYPKTTLAISGGEPLVRMKTVKLLLEAADSKIEPFILTNGHFFNERFFETILPYMPRMRVSIDGGDERSHDFIRGNGSFRKTLEGLFRLKEHSYDMSKLEFFCTLPPNQEHNLYSILELCEELNVSKVKVEPIAKTGRAKEFWPIKNTESYNDDDHYSFQLFFDRFQINKWNVNSLPDMSFSCLSIYSNGDVYPYVYYDEKDKKSALLGNISSSKLKDILDPDSIHKAIVSKLFTAYRGGKRSLTSKGLVRNYNK